MTKSEMYKKYVFVLLVLIVFFAFFWCEPVFRFLDWLSPIGSTRLLITSDPTGLIENYLNWRNVTVFYSILYILVLNYIFMTDNPTYIVRLKSRKFYVNKHISDTAIFTLVFVFVLEMVNLIGSTILLGFDTIIQIKLILYSLIDLVTIFLFCFRVGVISFILGVIAGKKYAPFVTTALILLEYAASTFFPVLQDIWLPNKDAVSITFLLSGSMQPIDILPAIIRGLIMNTSVIFFAYYIFLKKDLIGKKENN